MSLFHSGGDVIDVRFTLCVFIIEAQVTTSYAGTDDCCVCGQSNSLVHEVNVDSYTIVDGWNEGGDPSAEAIETYIKEKMQHGKGLCSECYVDIMEREFPNA